MDDQFFKLSEMEHFLEHEDQREAGQHSSSDESVDFFQPSDSDADEVCVCFFVPSCISLLQPLLFVFFYVCLKKLKIEEMVKVASQPFSSVLQNL